MAALSKLWHYSGCDYLGRCRHDSVAEDKKAIEQEYLSQSGSGEMSTAPDTALTPVPLGDEHLRFYENFSKKELFGRRLDGDFFRGMFCRRGLFFARQFHHFISGFCRVPGRRRSHFVLEGQEVGVRISQPNRQRMELTQARRGVKSVRGNVRALELADRSARRKAATCRRTPHLEY